jgi:phosphoadenosine phosphosulfate reductase
MAWIDLNEARETDAPQFEVILEPDADDETLKAAASEKILAIRFPKFRDGRGFTLARLLLEHHGFKGVLVATGHLIPDQAQFLLRSGFNVAEMKDEAHLASWQKALERFKIHFQKAWYSERLNREKKSSSCIAEFASQLESIDTLVGRLKSLDSQTKGRIAFATSLQKEDQAILFGLWKAGVKADVFTLDTGRLFPETYDIIALTQARYGIPIRVISPDAIELEELVAQNGVNGFYESIEKRKACCFTRKVQPLKRALHGASVWLTGVRRAQFAGRADMPLAAWEEAHELIKINPLVDWSDDDLECFLIENDIPVHALHHKGYPSIGCQPCTKPVKEGEDPRSGRWWWENQSLKECGLHVTQAA